MPRSKTQISKAPRDLRDPIELGRPSLLWNDAEMAKWMGEMKAFMFTEQNRKLDLLMDWLGIPKADGLVRHYFLSLELAKILYPGFLTTNDVKRKGRPSRGSGPVLNDPEFQLMWVDLFRAQGLAESDLEACKIYLKTFDKRLKSERWKDELTTRATSMASVVATARASARRKATGKIH